MDENCHVEPLNKIAPENPGPETASALLVIWGMGCPNCATRVQNSLLSLDGVHTAEVYLNMAMAEVLFDGRTVTPQTLVAAVTAAGNDGRHQYRAEVITA